MNEKMALSLSTALLDLADLIKGLFIAGLIKNEHFQ